MTFNPPEEGLKPGENVVWARKRGTRFWVIFFSMMLGIGGAVGTINAFVFVGLALALPLLILMATGFFFIFRAFMRGRGTKYYLTNERLIEARKGRIVKEISLERFRGKSLSQFFEKKVIGTVNDRPVYGFKIGLFAMQEWGRVRVARALMGSKFYPTNQPFDAIWRAETTNDKQYTRFRT